MGSKLDKQLVDLWRLKGSLCCKPPNIAADTEPEPDPRAELKRVCPFGQKNASICSTRFSVFYVAGKKASVNKNAILTFLCPCPAFATGALSIRQRSLQTDVAWEHTILQRLSPLPSNMPPRERISCLKDSCLVFEKVGAYHLL